MERVRCKPNLSLLLDMKLCLCILLPLCILEMLHLGVYHRNSNFFFAHSFRDDLVSTFFILMYGAPNFILQFLVATVLVQERT